MIRSSVFRNPLLKSALKKDVTAIKLIRCLTVVCKPNRRKITLRKNDVGFKPLFGSDRGTFYRFYSDYPNHFKITLPALSPTMESGTIVSWEKKEGDKLNEGDLLAEIETDKATMGFETPEEGYLAKILVPAGTKNVPIGKLVCIIVAKESDVAAFKNFVDEGGSHGEASSAPPLTSSQPSTPATQTKSEAKPSSIPLEQPPPAKSSTPPKDGQRIYASPLAKKLAAEKGIPLETIKKGSGIYGSITSQDVSASQVTKAQAQPSTVRPQSLGVKSSAGYADVPLPDLHSVMSKQVLLAKQTIPHYYLSVDVNVDKILSLKEKFNSVLVKDNINITLNDFVIKAAALASKKIPEANSSWQETFIRQYNTVDVSVRINTDSGFVSPVIFDADLKGIATISSEVNFLCAKAKTGTLQPEELEGGTISITNMGTYGIKNFCAIISPPQSCVLAIGSPEQKLVEDRNSSSGCRVTEILPVTLSCDHRTVDGAVGAQWLSHFKKFLEDPSTMIL